MPTPEDLTRRNLAWRQQVMDVHDYLEWARKAASNPQMIGNLEEALKGEA